MTVSFFLVLFILNLQFDFAESTKSVQKLFTCGGTVCMQQLDTQAVLTVSCRVDTFSVHSIARGGKLHIIIKTGDILYNALLIFVNNNLSSLGSVW